MSVLAEIRQATRPLHGELEGSLDIVRRLMLPTGRAAILCRFYAMHAVAEAALEPHLRPVPGLDFERRRKLPALLEDLRALGVAVPAAGCAGLNARFPLAGGIECALGIAYVLEGATLGGRVIRKHIAAAGGSLQGLSFFDVYGEATGEQWRRFCSVLERECAGCTAAALEGAVAGFGFARTALLEESRTPAIGPAEDGRRAWPQAPAQV